MKLGTVGLALVLMFAAACTAQEKPKGYDLAACSPAEYYAVHVKQDGKDFILDQITEEPGVVKTLKKEVRYVFEDSKDGIDSYAYQAGPNKLELKLKIGAKRGMYLQDGKLISVLFITDDFDGSKLAVFAVDNVKTCIDFINGPQEDPRDQNATN